MLCVIDVFTNYVCVKSLKYKKAKKFFRGFIKIVNESKRKPNKLRVYQEKEFYNSYMQKWLDDNGILMYSTHNEGKSVVVERFMRTLIGKIYKKSES